MIYSRITGTGSYLPEKVLTNKDLEEMVDTTDEWIFERTGIRERHVVEMESASDMAEHAARRALEMAGKKPEDVDLIIVGTSTPDLVFPSTACLLQNNLGIRNGGAAFDVQAACSGFVFALSVADKFVRSGTSKCALVVGSEAMSKILDWTDRGTCILFGDGAGAVVLEASDEAGKRHNVLPNTSLFQCIHVFVALCQWDDCPRVAACCHHEIHQEMPATSVAIHIRVDVDKEKV